jgi:hypothetical protein
MAVSELHLQFLAHQLIMLVVEAEAEITAQAIQQVVLVAMAVEVLAEIQQLLAQQIQAVEAVVVLTILPIIMVQLAVLVWLFCLYQQVITQEQRQAHRQSQPMVHIQF